MSTPASCWPKHETLGHAVLRAGDGNEAIALAASHEIDIALVDIGLPVIDGFEVAKRLRALKGQRVRLFAVTGYGQARDRETAVASGFDRHFVKPVDLGALAKAIRADLPES
jgi:CheY-like chemotaxis protein